MRGGYVEQILPLFILLAGEILQEVLTVHIVAPQDFTCDRHRLTEGLQVAHLDTSFHFEIESSCDTTDLLNTLAGRTLI